MADQTDIFAMEAFAAQSKLRIIPMAAGSREIREAIDFSYKGYGEIESQISKIFIPDETTDEGLAISATLDTPLTAALNLIVEEAVKLGLRIFISNRKMTGSGFVTASTVSYRT